ncbi:hypothetical protein BJX61DRAFT_502378, partial [Aspergillus egyptiacus]
MTFLFIVLPLPYPRLSFGLSYMRCISFILVGSLLQTWIPFFILCSGWAIITTKMDKQACAPEFKSRLPSLLSISRWLPDMLLTTCAMFADDA